MNIKLTSKTTQWLILISCLGAEITACNPKKSSRTANPGAASSPSAIQESPSVDASSSPTTDPSASATASVDPSASPSVTPSGTPINPDLSINDGTTTLKKVPQFAMLINDFRCPMCHLTVNGDAVSTTDIKNWSGGGGHGLLNDELVTGRWFTAGTFSTLTGDKSRNIKVKVNEGVQVRYKGKEMPADINGDGNADFPTIDFATIEPHMKGTLKATNLMVTNSTTAGNIIAIGTDAQPIEIYGEVLIKGDLVLKGKYRGDGTIYATGRIYIPANLVAMNSAFPYPADLTAAEAAAKEYVTAKSKDSLALATPFSIFIGDLDSGIYEDSVDSPPELKRAALQVDNVYKWMGGGKTAYQALYENGFDCLTSTATMKGSFNLIEAYLYAGVAITGISRKGSWAINGGVITNYLHIIGRASSHKDPPAMQSPICTNTVSPVHKLPQDRNYVNYDWRLKNGMALLREFAALFPN